MTTRIISNPSDPKAPRMLVRDILHLADEHGKALPGDGPTAWKRRHLNAVLIPSERFEAPLLGLIKSLADYAQAHVNQYGTPVGNDGVLGEGWESALRGFRALLNGDAGRLDCGTLDRAACELYAAAGFEGEL